MNQTTEISVNHTTAGRAYSAGLPGHRSFSRPAPVRRLLYSFRAFVPSTGPQRVRRPSRRARSATLLRARKAGTRHRFGVRPPRAAGTRASPLFPDPRALEGRAQVRRRGLRECKTLEVCHERSSPPQRHIRGRLCIDLCLQVS